MKENYEGNSRGCFQRASLRLKLEAALVCTLLVIIWGLLSLPIVFYFVPVEEVRVGVVEVRLCCSSINEKENNEAKIIFSVLLLGIIICRYCQMRIQMQLMHLLTMAAAHARATCSFCLWRVCATKSLK